MLQEKRRYHGKGYSKPKTASRNCGCYGGNWDYTENPDDFFKSYDSSSTDGYFARFSMAVFDVNDGSEVMNRFN